MQLFISPFEKWEVGRIFKKSLYNSRHILVNLRYDGAKGGKELHGCMRGNNARGAMVDPSTLIVS